MGGMAAAAGTGSERDRFRGEPKLMDCALVMSANGAMSLRQRLCRIQIRFKSVTRHSAPKVSVASVHSPVGVRATTSLSSS